MMNPPSAIELVALKGEARALVHGAGHVDQFCRRAARARGKKGTDAARLRGAAHLYRTERMSFEQFMAFLVKWSNDR